MMINWFFSPFVCSCTNCSSSLSFISPCISKGNIFCLICSFILDLLFLAGTLSPMHFTHYTMDTITSSCGVTGRTLQIYSIEILELKKGLKWPLRLYGVVTARDTVDRNSNILFSRSGSHYQELGENVCIVFSFLLVSINCFFFVLLYSIGIK
jgi:hypothetical protein